MLPREGKFVQYMSLYDDPTKAAIKAKYDPRHAKKVGETLIARDDIREAVERCRIQREQDLNISSNWVLGKLVNIIIELEDGETVHKIVGKGEAATVVDEKIMTPQAAKTIIEAAKAINEMQGYGHKYNEGDIEKEPRVVLNMVAGQNFKITRSSGLPEDD